MASNYFCRLNRTAWVRRAQSRTAWKRTAGDRLQGAGDRLRGRGLSASDGRGDQQGACSEDGGAENAPKRSCTHHRNILLFGSRPAYVLAEVGLLRTRGVARAEANGNRRATPTTRSSA